MATRTERTRQIMKTIGLSEERVNLFRLADGTSPLVVALPNEYISEVIDRVQRIGGSANVAIAYPTGFELLHLREGATADGEVVISQDMSIGMVSIRVKQNPGKTIRLRFRDADVEVPEFESELAYSS